MDTEFEVKFVNIDPLKFIDKLKLAGAQLNIPMRLMRRVIIETPQLREQNGYVRIRDEGNKVTVTYKTFDALTVDGAKEIEVIVDNFDKTLQLFEKIGLHGRSFQESKRETWTLNDAEVVIDEWPWLNPYIEIEGTNVDHVKQTAAKLGLDWKRGLFGDVMVAYRSQYPHLTISDTVANLDSVRFDDTLPKLLIPPPSSSR